MTHEEELKGPKLRAWGNMTLAFRYLKNCHVERELDFLCAILEGNTKIRGWKFQEGRQLDRREFGSLQTNELPCKRVSYSFLEVFRQRLCTFYQGCGRAVHTFVIGLSDLLVF